MGRFRPITSIDYSNQLAANMNRLDQRERVMLNDVIHNRYLRQVFQQYEPLGLQTDTLLFVTLTALGAIGHRSFIRRLDNIPALLNHGSLIVGKTGNKERP